MKCCLDGTHKIHITDVSDNRYARSDINGKFIENIEISLEQYREFKPRSCLSPDYLKISYSQLEEFIQIIKKVNEENYCKMENISFSITIASRDKNYKRSCIICKDEIQQREDEVLHISIERSTNKINVPYIEIHEKCYDKFCEKLEKCRNPKSILVSEKII